jgi:ABC-2 type transport system permease protein
MFGVSELSSLSFYGGNYISYVLIGSIGWGFMWSISGATSNALRSEMTMGTLEAIMSTPTRITTLVLSYTIFGAIFGVFSILLTLGVGVAIFGVGIVGTVSAATMVVFLLMMVMMGGIGMMFGGLTVWTKNVGQLVGFFQNVSMFFAGVYFPLSVLPELVRPVANVLPFYYSIEGLRRSLLPGTPDVWYYAGITAVAALVMIICGYLTLKYGIKKAKKDGSLSFY